MDYLKIIKETREMHQNFSLIELRISLFISVLFKALFSRTGTFLSVLIVPFGINILFFYLTGNAMRLVRGILVSLVFAVFGMKYLIKMDGIEEFNQEQKWTSITLKKMIKERQGSKNVLHKL
ncbi:hypothetical protein [Flavobacterium soyangense]|uniref:Uncharacterized protein n=1 Tax=Flavobacterium soyangense TaxID=2023265 RepID=A0A930UF42_9FLAO|nr:hypothetical protein [Flavobacterium soyangense]MBF2709737.1 hypothetical protein [Flavobacterium soyangense]